MLDNDFSYNFNIMRNFNYFLSDAFNLERLPQGNNCLRPLNLNYLLMTNWFFNNGLLLNYLWNNFLDDFLFFID